MQTKKQVNDADAVVWAHQFEFLVLGQIAQMDRAEFSERDDDADRHHILVIFVSWLEAGAIGVRRTGSGQYRLDSLACGGHYLHIQARDRDLVARLGDGVLSLGVKL